jgi:hypothetical protein
MSTMSRTSNFASSAKRRLASTGCRGSHRHHRLGRDRRVRPRTGWTRLGRKEPVMFDPMLPPTAHEAGSTTTMLPTFLFTITPQLHSVKIPNGPVAVGEYCASRVGRRPARGPAGRDRRVPPAPRAATVAPGPTTPPWAPRRGALPPSGSTDDRALGLPPSATRPTRHTLANEPILNKPFLCVFVCAVCMRVCVFMCGRA